jgi:hypothetical protein
MATERVLHAYFFGLLAASVLAFVLAGCASPTGRDPRDAIAAESSPTERSAAAQPRFAQSGPDAEDYGASAGYPVGDRATCPAHRSSSVVTAISTRSMRVGWCAAPPSPLARAASEPVVRYEYQAKHSPLTITSRAIPPPASSSPGAIRS